MNRITVGAGLALLLASSAFGQKDVDKPEFDVADIRQNISGDAGMQGGILPGGQFSVRNAPLKILLGFAFNEPNQVLTPLGINANNQRFYDSFIVGAPRWVDSDRFDIVGKAPPDTPAATLALMLRTFLEKQLKMQTHQEQRPMDVFAMVMGKGPLKLQKTTRAGNTSCRRIAGGSDDPAAKELSDDQAGFVCVNMTMVEFARVVPQMAPAYIDHAAVDLTGLEGPYDFKLVWVARQLIDQGGLNVFDAINNIGLKLEARKVPMPVLIIDRMEKLDDAK